MTSAQLDPRRMTPAQKGLSGVLIVLCLAMPLLAYKWPTEHEPSGWLLTVLIATAFIVVAGKYCKGLWRGVLVDQRNMLSLSRFQMVIWTVVILPGWFAIVFHNLAVEHLPDALDVTIPNDLLILLGIPTVTLVGAPLVRKKQEEASSDDTKREVAKKAATAPSTKNPAAEDLDAGKDVAAAQDGGKKPVEVKTIGDGKVVIGKTVRNKDPKDANWGDLLKGDTPDDYDTLDLAKVQMFLFTFLFALGYAFSFAKLFAITDGKIEALPPISEGMAMILGISNTAYLTNKAVK